jgi:chromatin remodeling complex protein RSC6
MPAAKTATKRPAKSTAHPEAKSAAKTPGKSRKAEPEEVQQTPLETPVEVTETTPGGTRVRRQVTVETVDEEFTSILQSLQDEFTVCKDAGRPVSKFLRTLNKRLGVLQKDTRRITKGKRRNPGAASENSGFNKQTNITPELAKFLGVKPGTKMSRVNATSGIQEYIVANNLKDPENGRIVRPNKELTKLLGYRAKDHVDTTLNKKGDPKNPEGLLYYWVIQKLIQKHFLPDE